MLAKEGIAFRMPASSGLRPSFSSWADSLRGLRHDVRASGPGRYSLAMAALTILALWLLWIDPADLLDGHQIYLTLIGIITIALLGAGPGLLMSGGLLAVGYVIVHENLRYGAMHSSAFLCMLAAANVVALKSTFWRVRAEKQAAHAGRLAEQLKLMTDGAMRYALYMTDGAGYIVQWTKGAERFTGRSEQDVLGRHLTELYDQQPEMKEHLARALSLAEQHGGCEYDSEFFLPTGAIFVQNCVITALYDDHGRVRNFAHLVRDITAEREREIQLEERSAELRSILETTPEAVFVINDKGQIDFVNGQACRIFGYDAQHLRGEDFNQLLAAGQPARVRPEPVLGECPSRDDLTPRKLIGCRRDGSHFPIELTFVRVEGLRRIQCTAFVRDLTEEEATKARLELLRGEMLHGTRYSAMGAMASILAHELNQPLTAIAAYLEGSAILLKREELDRPKLEKAFLSAATESVRAGAIMRRLRSFVSSGEAQLEVHDIQEVIDGSVALVRAGARAAAVDIVVDIAYGAGPVFADPIQIQQVIGNLCRNAIDAMRDSRERRLTIHAHAQDESTTHILITDTGPGVPPELRDRIFDAFVSHKDSGTGVGLSICRTIVEAHGGRMWVRSDPSGSCFSFSLKRKRE